MGKDEMTLKDVVLLFSVLGMTVSILVLVGILGSLDLDKITFAEAVKKSSVWMVICFISVFGLIKSESDADEY